MDGGAVTVGFEDALKEAEGVVIAFNTAAGDEENSQKAKNAALYAALDRAFQFHRTWHGSPEFGKLLEQRKVNAKPRGKNASPYIPTIKAFFDANLDSFDPADEAGKADKARRQKTVSTYSKVLEFAASSEDGSKDVVAFIAKHGGVEATKAEWNGLQKKTDEAQAKAQEAERTKQQNLGAGLAALKATMAKTLPQDVARKGGTALAALYFDDAGVAHLLGFPPVTDGSKALLEKFLLDAAPEKKTSTGKEQTTVPVGEHGLDKLLKLLAVGKVAHANDANVKLINGNERCELWSSHGSAQTCMVHAVLSRQDYLHEGTYWFGAKAIKAMQHLAKLGAHGAKFTITGPMAMDGKIAVVKVTVTGHEDAVKAYNQKAGVVSWDWFDAIPDGDGRCRTSSPDGSSTTIAFRSATEKLAVAKPVDEWKAEVPVAGDFAAWLERTLAISKKDANAKLVKAVFGGTGGKLTKFRIGAKEWVLMAGHEDMDAHPFDPAIAFDGGPLEFTEGRGDLLAAKKAVTGLVGGGTPTITLIDKFMRVRCEADGRVAEVFIPSFTSDGHRYAGHTEFLT
ncbi:hypothetical protein [Magnetospirillum sulfuroxidans]|uniref:Uncharacterized protein n=1 Tax=Magnetospirillum sulfuroxidans TaxID=611300 RepID=A0ABS5IDE5_9PROT|nr:hypothetical protein [Magnetospirillum sulfuroxidans]MBR9972448.1 hypothetical protein [Magnetospirillum sulfuroxidans]